MEVTVLKIRANPSTEDTDPFCRIPLLTLNLKTRGYKPWRPVAVIGTGMLIL